MLRHYRHEYFISPKIFLQCCLLKKIPYNLSNTYRVLLFQPLVSRIVALDANVKLPIGNVLLLGAYKYIAFETIFNGRVQ